MVVLRQITISISQLADVSKSDIAAFCEMGNLNKFEPEYGDSTSVVRRGFRTDPLLLTSNPSIELAPGAFYHAPDLKAYLNPKMSEKGRLHPCAYSR